MSLNLCFERSVTYVDSKVFQRELEASIHSKPMEKNLFWGSLRFCCYPKMNLGLFAQGMSGETSGKVKLEWRVAGSASSYSCSG